MKNLLSILLLVFISCKSISQNKTSGEGESIKTSEVLDSSSPGTINFTGKIINVYTESLTICGAPQNNMVSMQLDEIIEKSNSLINPPQKEKTVFFKFLNKTSTLKSGDDIKAYAKEYLCTDGVETYFVVTQFEKN